MAEMKTELSITKDILCDIKEIKEFLQDIKERKEKGKDGFGYCER